MPRTVATLLAVASPLLVTVPVGAAAGSSPGGAATSPAAFSLTAIPAGPVTAAPPAVTAPAPSSLSAAAAVAPLTVPAVAPGRWVASAVHQPTHRSRDLDNAAYAARLQAQLCVARTVFCGLDRRGRYPLR